MTTEKDLIENLFATFDTATIININKLPKSGGDRVYYRITTGTTHDVNPIEEKYSMPSSFSLL